MISRVYLWLFSLIISVQLYGQGRKKIELVVRDSIVYIKGSDMPYTGIGVVYADDLLTEKIHYVDGVRHGLTTKYTNVFVEEVTKKKGKRKDGRGLLIYEVNYKQGIKDGMEYEYGYYGNINRRVKYVNGVKEGVEYTGGGYVAYRNGQKEGPELKSHSLNRAALYVNYVNGKEEGMKYIFSVRYNGMAPAQYTNLVLPYKNGVLDGSGIRKGGKYGRETVYFNFKNGRKEGKEEYVDTSDFTTKRKVYNYVNGKLDGVATYYEHDIVLTEVPYVNGKRHGVRKNYDLNRKLIKEVYYSNGECVKEKLVIKEEVYVGKVVAVDSLQVKGGLIYEMGSSEPYTGKGEEYNERGEFWKDVFYVNGVVEHENEYDDGMLYQKKIYKNGELSKHYYSNYSSFKDDQITEFKEAEVRKKVAESTPVVVKMYVGSESGNGELNSDASDISFGVKIVNGRREGTWKFDIDKKGVPTKQGMYVNNRLEGDVIGKDGKTVIEQYKDGLLHGEVIGHEDINEKVGVTNYVDGYITGIVSRYHKNSMGSFLVEINYKYSLPCGEILYYNEKGVLEGSTTFEYGIKQGISREYYENGKVKTEVNYVDDEEQGEKKTYSPTGELLNTVYYDKGSLNGYLITFYKNMTKNSECNYVNGLEEGEKKVYDEQGVLKEKSMYKGGYLHGEQIIYWPNTTIIKVRGNFKYGRQDGEKKEYDVNGVLVRGVIYSNGSFDRVNEYE